MKLDELLEALKRAPRDVELLGKIGDHHQLLGQPKQAARYYWCIAEVYASDGFVLKAIALAKQVVRLDASLTDAVALLASTHEAIGQKAEAVAWTRTLIKHCTALQDADGVARGLEALKRLGA